MKHHLLTILILIFISFSGISQDTKAVFFSHDLGKFHLYINSQLVERAPQNQISFDSKGMTKMMVKIVFQEHNLKPITGEIKLKLNKTTVYVIYTKNGILKFDKHEKIKLGQYKPGKVAAQYYDMPEYQGRLGCGHPCSLEIINIAITQMKTESGSMAQMTIASELVKNNCVTVTNLSAILKAFSYESDKVEFAKYAWPYIYDQENYFNLSSVFEYPQSLQEINTFVKTNQ